MNPTKSFLEFTCVNDHYGVELLSIKEVLARPEKITPVPLSPSYVKGLINLRGEIVTIINLGTKLKNQATGKEELIIVFKVNNFLVGALVDSVPGVVEVPLDQISDLPSGNFNREQVTSVIKQKDHLTLVFNPECLLT